ncbi:MAG: uroporphyrinogen decarboxylase family protein [Clostridia bacterium]|nr:uroporphyrinogen decarboxylase family protein [Clostridia bacterium]
MKRRERLLNTINHREPDRVPVGFDIHDNKKVEMMKYYGVADYRLFYQKTGIECFSVWDWPAVLPIYKGPVPDGVTYVSDNQMSSHGCWGKESELIYPMENLSLDEYRWPSVDEFDFTDIASGLNEVHQLDMTTASAHAGVGFTHHYQLRSYEKTFFDLMDASWMEEYMGINREFFIEYFKRLFKYANGKIDIIRADEDLGGQENMSISPALWRKWYKPLWRDVFKICKENGAKIWMHSCGFCRDVVDDFIEIGVDILNPVPVYVRGSDPLDMKQTYGDVLAFDGGVDQIHVLIEGTPAMVREEVKLRIEQMAPGGGFIIGPSQVFTDDMPLENIVAFFDAAHEFGEY